MAGVEPHKRYVVAKLTGRTNTPAIPLAPTSAFCYIPATFLNSWLIRARRIDHA